MTKEKWNGNRSYWRQRCQFVDDSSIVFDFHNEFVCRKFFFCFDIDGLFGIDVVHRFQNPYDFVDFRLENFQFFVHCDNETATEMQWKTKSGSRIDQSVAMAMFSTENSLMKRQLTEFGVAFIWQLQKAENIEQNTFSPLHLMHESI